MEGRPNTRWLQEDREAGKWQLQEKWVDLKAIPKVIGNFRNLVIGWAVRRGIRRQADV